MKQYYEHSFVIIHSDMDIITLKDYWWCNDDEQIFLKQIMVLICIHILKWYY